MKHLYQIREISTLSFNERVLQEAEDRRNPLQERLRFLGIFSSNMDEFFKVRVAGIKRMIEMGRPAMREVLRVVNEKSLQLDERFRRAYQEVTTGMAQEGVAILNERDLEAHSTDLVPWVRDYFQDKVLPHLVPIIMNRKLRFPQVRDGALYFALALRGAKTRFAILEIPSSIPRFVQLPNNNIMYLDDVIRYNLDELFYIFEYDRIEAYEFKISRDAELDIDNDFTEDYLLKMERVLEQRKVGRLTRLVYDASIPEQLLDILKRELGLGDQDPLLGGGRYHNMKDLMDFPVLNPSLCFEPMDPVKHPVLDRAGRVPMLDVAVDQDVLLTYPYQSFSHVIRLLRESAIDPSVTAIKMTMYRAAKGSQVVNALMNAAQNGKRVTVCIELQARFDEENNIRIAERLREAGATVFYGFPNFKTHSKLMLIARGDKRFAGLSTGNYNEKTSELYVDSWMLTAHQGIAAEVDQVFEQLRVQRLKPEPPSFRFRHLLVSPFNTRKVMLRQISQEMEKGKKGYILFKVNHLTDERIVKRLMEAADAGVSMDLIVRTTYGLTPHKNMRAISILDRYLEHQRAYIFGRGSDQRVFMSSADLMQRNLDSRVEVGFPIYDPKLRKQVADMMTIQVDDNYKARYLDETQSNPYVGDAPNVPRARRAADATPERIVRAQYDTHAYLRNLYLEEITQPDAEDSLPKAAS